MTTTAVATIAPSPAPRRRPLTPQTVLALQGYRVYPSVSLLLNTRPGAQMEPADADRLAALVDQARRRLAHEPPEHAGAAAELDRRLAAIPLPLDGPCEQAVALYLSPVQLSRVDLSVAVVERAVIDPTFATRDLVRSLHRTPRHVVLMLRDDEARLFDGQGDLLVPARAGFPLADPQHRPGTPARLRFLQTVDKALGAYLRLHPAPLVVAGPQPTLSSFVWASRNTTRLAGTLTGDFFAEPAAVRPHTRPLLEQYLRSRQAEALRLLATRRSQGRAVTDIQKAWMAAHHERPEMLTVEQSYFYPARLEDDGLTLCPAADVHAPDVIDDVVDELIELVIARGGWIAMVDDDVLPGTRLALTLRRP